MKKEIKKWIDNVEKVKKGEFDLSIDEDLSIAIMNLISIEEHFYFTAMKTNNQKYFDLLKSVRELRGKLLKRLVTNPKGEEWCLSKHLLASSMRLIEVGTKELSRSNKKDANMFFNSAFEMYSLFFALNLKLIDSKKLGMENKKPTTNIFSGLIKKILDCCKEW